MRINGRDRRKPTVVRDSEDADAAVIVLDVLHQPVDRVVSVGTLIDTLCIFRIAHWPSHHELAFRTVPSANILRHKDVAVSGQVDRKSTRLNSSQIPLS